MRLVDRCETCVLDAGRPKTRAMYLLLSSHVSGARLCLHVLHNVVVLLDNNAERVASKGKQCRPLSEFFVFPKRRWRNIESWYGWVILCSCVVKAPRR